MINPPRLPPFFSTLRFLVMTIDEIFEEVPVEEAEPEKED